MEQIKRLVAGAVLQWRDVRRSLLLLYIPVGLLFIGVGILTRVVDDASLAFFLRDVVLTGELPFFAGFVSQVEMILWSASLTVCLFSLIVLHSEKKELPGPRRLLLQGGLLTGILLIDDIFLFHEEIAPDYLHISENIVIVLYLAMSIVFVASNWYEILDSEYLILSIALFLFANSILLDAIPVDEYDLRYFWEQLEIFLEDGFKFAGIATWLLYFSRYSVQKIGGGPQGITFQG
jgi:hypothetical protein